MERKSIYISGPISGLDYEEAKAAFSKVENALRERYGATVDIINPTRLCMKEWAWEQCMRVCIVALCRADYIHMLPGFTKSRGARLELTIAQALGMGVCNDTLDLVDYEKEKAE